MAGKLFYSVEVEGKHTGCPTLFVEGNVSVEAIMAAKSRYNTSHVYFGAVYKGSFGEPSEVNGKTVATIVNTGDIITVEALFPNLAWRTLLECRAVEFMIPAPALSRWMPVLNTHPKLWDRIQLKYRVPGGYVVVAHSAHITRIADYDVDLHVNVEEFA